MKIAETCLAYTALLALMAGTTLAAPLTPTERETNPCLPSSHPAGSKDIRSAQFGGDDLVGREWFTFVYPRPADSDATTTKPDTNKSKLRWLPRQLYPPTVPHPEMFGKADATGRKEKTALSEVPGPLDDFTPPKGWKAVRNSIVKTRNGDQRMVVVLAEEKPAEVNQH